MSLTLCSQLQSVYIQLTCADIIIAIVCSDSEH